MRLLALVSSTLHAHDYGIDYLLDGFRVLAGAEHAIDWPPKPCLHIPEGEPRDGCTIDSDAWWPVPPDAALPIEELSQTADLVFLAMSLEDPAACERTAAACRLVPRGTPIVALDMHDSVTNRRPLYEAVAGRSVVYFKRELPLGADWGLPCPLTYPAARVPNPLPPKLPRVVYHATHHGNQPPGVPRFRIAEDLRRLLQPSQLDIALYPSQQNRPTPEQYHAKMAKGLVGIHWNGAANWDANRWSEGLAFGLCQVAERPRIQMPAPYEHLRHGYFVERPEEVAPAVKMLLQAPTWALAIASAGHRHFLEHHCSRARAQYVVDAVGRMG